MSNQRNYSLIDRFCMNVDQALRGVLGTPESTHRAYPAAKDLEPELTLEQKKYSAALMRVNHAGEVSAQALYQGQGLVSSNLKVREKMQQAAIEEGDHLAWCHQRLEELGSHTSYFNPLWYIGSLSIGMLAGFCGDRWSLGFLAETEQQVVKHLEGHLKKLPKQDQKSLKILQQMQEDEGKHRDEAIDLGAAVLPSFIKKSMAVVSKVMVKIAFYL